MNKKATITKNIAQSMSQLQAEFSNAHLFAIIEDANLIIKRTSSADENIKFDFSEFPKTSGGSTLTSSAHFTSADKSVSTQTFNNVADFPENGEAVVNDFSRLTKYVAEKLPTPSYLH